MDELKMAKAIEIFKVKSFTTSLGSVDDFIVLSSLDKKKSVELNYQEYVSALFRAFTGSDLGGM